MTIHGRQIADFRLIDVCGFDDWLSAQSPEVARTVLLSFRSGLESLCNQFDGDLAYGDHLFDLERVQIKARARFTSRELDDGYLTLALLELREVEGFDQD